MKIEIYKWPEIENTYKEDESFEKAMQLKNIQWVITEKIDGTNFGLNIFRDDYVFNSRNNILGHNASFYNIYENVYLIQDVIDKFEQWFLQKSSTIERVLLYGEYFGKKVMNRIDYRKNYDFRFYSLQLITESGNRTVLSFKSFLELMTTLDLEEYVVPILGVRDNFKEAIKFPNNLPSIFNDKVKMEGIVIQPYEIPYDYFNRLKLIFKSKNKDFEEITKRGHTVPSDIPVEEIQRMKALKLSFALYCTESRMYSIISKMYKPTSEKEFGKFVGPFIEDAYKDFIKDNPELNLTDKERKFITNIGSDGFMLFSKIISKLNNGE